LKRTLGYVQREGVPDGEFHYILSQKLNYLKELFGWTSLADQQLNTHVCWFGHIARMPADSPVFSAYQWRNASWRLGQHGLGLAQGFRHGANKLIAAEDDIVEMFGPMWAELAHDRQEWAAAKIVYLNSKHARLNAAGNTADYPFHYSNRTLNWIGSARMSLVVPVMHIVTDEMVYAQTVGKRGIAKTSPFYQHVKQLRWVEHLCRSVWKCVPAHSSPTLLQFGGKEQGDSFTKFAEFFARNEVYSVRDHNVVPLSMIGHPELIVIQSGAVKLPLTGSVFWLSTISIGVGDQLIVVAFCGSHLDKGTCVQGAAFESAVLGFRNFVEWSVAQKLVV
jgi:hypothetical protein